MARKTLPAWCKIRHFLREAKGVSAVEFALIAPVMAVMYFGSVELSFMMQQDRKVTTAAATLGDLTSRAAVITDDDMDDIIQATRMIMQPADITNARIRVTSLVDKDDDGVLKVDWSDARNMTAHPEDQVMTVPEDIVPIGGSVILAEFEYDFESPLGFFVTEKINLGDSFYLRPRRGDFVTRLD